VDLDLPDDDWVHLWSSRRFGGGPVCVEAPPGCPAVFFRASSGFAGLFDTIRRSARRI
jgi:alpha-glucosidase